MAARVATIHETKAVKFVSSDAQGKAGAFAKEGYGG